jgi:pimeloyl-ACP methyl ester carboxylesterase
MEDAPLRVRHRHVIYVQGYDPRGLAVYYRMFAGEYARSCTLHGLAGDVTRPVGVPGRFADRWSYGTRGDGWEVRTTYDFLRWDDIIRRDFARPTWWKLLQMVGILLRTIVNGVWLRILRAHWRFALFAIYPLVLLLLFAALAAGLGALGASAASALVSPLPAVLGALVAAAAFVFLLRVTESRTRLLYLCDDIVSTQQYAHQRRPDWEERFQEFAAHVTDVLRTTDADEVVLVGHSSGSYVAVDVLARALALDPGLGSHGPRLALLTIGANLPIVGFHRRAQWFRDRLARLAVEPAVAWVDYQSRHDIMNFWHFDPIDGHRIVLPAKRRNPTVVSASFRRAMAAEGFWLRRFHFFRLHFQFLCANERPGSTYDYYLICCGPDDLVTRATRPWEVAMPADAPQDGSPNPVACQETPSASAG